MRPVAFVRYDAAGNITEWGWQSEEAVAAEAARGVRILVGEGRPESHRVENGALVAIEPGN